MTTQKIHPESLTSNRKPSRNVSRNLFIHSDFGVMCPQTCCLTENPSSSLCFGYLFTVAKTDMALWKWGIRDLCINIYREVNKYTKEQRPPTWRVLHHWDTVLSYGEEDEKHTVWDTLQWHALNCSVAQLLLCFEVREGQNCSWKDNWLDLFTDWLCQL